MAHGGDELAGAGFLVAGLEGRVGLEVVVLAGAAADVPADRADIGGDGADSPLDVVAAGLPGGLVTQALGALPGGEAAGDAAVALEVGEALALAIGAADEGGVGLLALDELDALERAGRVLGAGLVVAADVGPGAADARGLQQEAEAKTERQTLREGRSHGPGG